MTTIVEYNYSEDLFHDHSGKIKYVRLRGSTTYNVDGVLGSGLTINNLYVSTDSGAAKPLITISNNTINRKWTIDGNFNADLTSSQYDIVVAGMEVETAEVFTSPITPTELALFEDDYSDPAKTKEYERLVIKDADPEVQVKYEIYNADYSGAYKITGVRSDDVANIRSWNTAGVANPADPVAPTTEVDLAVVTVQPVRLKKSSDNSDYPLASTAP